MTDLINQHLAEFDQGFPLDSTPYHILSITRAEAHAFLTDALTSIAAEAEKKGRNEAVDYIVHRIGKNATSKTLEIVGNHWKEIISEARNPHHL